MSHLEDTDELPILVAVCSEDGLPRNVGYCWVAFVMLSGGERELEIVAHPIPTDLATVKAIASAPAVLDLFMWLTYPEGRKPSRFSARPD